MGRLLLPSGARLFTSAIFCAPRSRISPGTPALFLHSISSVRPSNRAFASLSALRASIPDGQKFSPTMTSAEALPPAVEGLSLQSTTETSKFPNSFPSLNPVDIYREHISEKLADATGLEAEKIYPKLNWTSTLDKGDLVLPVWSDQLHCLPCFGWD